MTEPEQPFRETPGGSEPAVPGLSRYRFRLLRYAPNRLSEEFYNVAALLYDDQGLLLEARFAPDFVRLRSNPLADLRFLVMLKEDFESRRLLGEGFSEYVERLQQDLSQGLQISEEKVFLGGEAAGEIERLARTYLATLHRPEGRAAGFEPGSRRWVQSRLRDTFQLYHLTGRLDAGVPVGSFVSPRFSFQIDYGYKPNGETRYIHALSARNDLTDAGRLCFVFDRIRARQPSQMTAVVGDALPADTRELLESSRIRPWAVSKLDDLALAVRDELGI